MPSLETIRKIDIRNSRGDMNISDLKIAQKSCSVYEFLNLGLKMLDKGNINEGKIPIILREKIERGKNKISSVNSFLKEKLKDWRKNRFSKFIDENIEKTNQKNIHKIEVLKSSLGKIGAAKAMIVDYLMQKRFTDSRSLWENIIEEDKIKKYIKEFFQRSQKYSYQPKKKEERIEKILEILGFPSFKVDQVKEKSKITEEETKHSTRRDNEKGKEQKKLTEKEISDLEKLLIQWIEKKAFIFSFDKEKVISNESIKNKLIGGAIVTPSKKILKIVRPRGEEETENNYLSNLEDLEELFENLFLEEVKEFRQNFPNESKEAEIYKVILDSEGNVQTSDSKII
ncbi:hypothetical protein AKJ43_02745 [candidate division MSBL1 archaeon SCGC-AAA261D19]|uniref:Uncharacterized protein n=1 Tax=candidate division MSBL1 archaeon SCGC-AAA261D19 TaxID=1698273 RepID=A0A133V6A1_9EURY|nr:hypothetical protein AKJ43_02745 [candidate division MSBL1 archaeon SCGC-AAA261D19]